MRPVADFQFLPKYKKIAAGVMALGALATVAAFFQDPHRAWAGLLVNNYYFVSLALAGLFFVTVRYPVGGAWSAGIRRVPEAMMMFLPAGLVLMMPLFFGREFLYHWADAEVLRHDPVLAAKHVWLNAPFFFSRMALILGVWTLFAWLIRRASLAEDKIAGPEDVTYYHKLFRYSVLFIPVFAVTFSLASFDWIMSVEPHWYSTIFSIYAFSGLFLHGVALITLIVVLLKERGYLEGIVNENHLHDLAKIILAFSIFWISMWVNQYMLIWYTNIPEEVVYYSVRTDRDWHWLFILNIVLNWGVPFLILLPRASKRSLGVLKRVCLTLLVGHWVDTYLMVFPNVVKTRQIGLTEIFMTLGYGALFFYITARALSRAPLVAQNDPYLEESLHHHQ